jgi:hypothetical protein
MSYISKIIGKTFFSVASLADAPVAKPYKAEYDATEAALSRHSKGLSSVLDGMRAENMKDWGARCRKEHGERVEARKAVNGKTTDKE